MMRERLSLLKKNITGILLEFRCSIQFILHGYAMANYLIFTGLTLFAFHSVEFTMF